MEPKGMRSVVRRHGLAPEEIVEVRRLADLCNQYEGLDLPVNLAAPGDFPGHEIEQFLAYEDGALVGFLSADPGREIEVCGMAHPERRRNGIGRALIAAAKEACRQRGVASWLLVSEEASESGKAFAASLGAQYRYSEYRMELDRAAVPEIEPKPRPVLLEPISAEDVEPLAHLLAASFGGSEENRSQQIARNMQSRMFRYYLGRVAGEPIGTLGLSLSEPSVYIIALGVLPEQRRRGYGRQMLMQAIHRLLAEEWQRILIEVLTDNRNALSLYRSCGFRETTAYGFYRMAV
jgi:ribosomal protein S18 acetylase RimI-like enzyme